MSVPVIIEIFASLDAVRTTLVSLGATSPERRSVAFQLAEHLLLLGVDDAVGSTVVAVGGADPEPLARWLLNELTDVLPCEMHTVPEEPTGELATTG